MEEDNNVFKNKNVYYPSVKDSKDTKSDTSNVIKIIFVLPNLGVTNYG